MAEVETSDEQEERTDAERLLGKILRTSYCRLEVGHRQQHRCLTVKAFRTIPPGTDPFLGKPYEVITLPRERMEELPDTVQTGGSENRLLLGLPW